MTKVRRGGFIFIQMDLESHVPMEGLATGKLLALIRRLEDEGVL